MITEYVPVSRFADPYLIVFLDADTCGLLSPVDSIFRDSDLSPISTSRVDGLC